MQDKVVVVTGGAGGIGSVLARGFHGSGARVAVLDVSAVPMAALESELEAAGGGGEAAFFECDVSSYAACEAAVRQTVERFGAVHALVNNAALGMGAIRRDHMTNLVTIDEIDPEVWARFVAVNLNGAFYMTRAVAPHMRKQGFGRIVNVTTSYFTMLRGRFHPYGPTKAGMEAMAAGHAKEFAGTGITVNVVVPGGPADTPMVPQEAGFDRAALIPPSAMVAPIAWLISDAAGEVNGRRFVAAEWDASLDPAEAAAAFDGEIGWPALALEPVWPGGKPDAD